MIPLKRFRLAGVLYGPPANLEPFQASVRTAKEINASLDECPAHLAKDPEQWEALKVQAEERLSAAQNALAAEKSLRPEPMIPDDAWLVLTEHRRKTLIGGRYVIAEPDLRDIQARRAKQAASQSAPAAAPAAAPAKRRGRPRKVKEEVTSHVV